MGGFHQVMMGVEAHNNNDNNNNNIRAIYRCLRTVYTVEKLAER